MSNTVKPSTARTAEANGQTIAAFEYRGHTFTVSRDQNEWPLDFIEAAEDGHGVGMIRGALGPAQWRVVKGMGLKRPDVDELANTLAAAMGFTDAGESAASTD